ncbi:MAG: MaoC family dehydratase N-terminal domain-containing protein [Dehalococcoidales bacterium]
MPESEKLDYDQLEVGHEFPPVSYRLDKSMVEMFLEAVEEVNSLYRDMEIVPPMALAARAMAALAECVSPPPGSIHISQELEFQSAVKTGETITCVARILRKQERGKLRIMIVGLDVFNQSQEKIAAAKTSFMLPVPD